MRCLFGGESHCHRPRRRMRNGGWIHVRRSFFCAAWWKRVCNHTNISVHTVRCCACSPQICADHSPPLHTLTTTVLRRQCNPPRFKGVLDHLLALSPRRVLLGYRCALKQCPHVHAKKRRGCGIPERGRTRPAPLAINASRSSTELAARPLRSTPPQKRRRNNHIRDKAMSS